MRGRGEADQGHQRTAACLSQGERCCGGSHPPLSSHNPSSLQAIMEGGKED